MLPEGDYPRVLRAERRAFLHEQRTEHRLGLVRVPGRGQQQAHALAHVEAEVQVGLGHTQERLVQRAVLGERLVRQAYEAAVDWDAAPAAAGVSEEQLAYTEKALAEHTDARWTFVFMHMPLWQGEGHPAYRRLRAALGDRPYTMFAGHMHNYRATEIDGNSPIRLGPTGGVWVFPEGDPGNVDHVTLVTVTADGPVPANLALDGIRDADGRVV